MNERIYRTPRTYGAPTGYDHERTHFPNQAARLSEVIAQGLAYAGAPSSEIALCACAVAEDLLAEWDRRGWWIEIEDAPDMDKNYGAKRGDPEPK